MSELKWKYLYLLICSFWAFVFHLVNVSRVQKLPKQNKITTTAKTYTLLWEKGLCSKYLSNFDFFLKFSKLNFKKLFQYLHFI